ncbi:MAG: hypothetical protein IPP81_03505 [Chitinophagaceae bacterium]|nr:hypothetical protein [Chitinophagaceae bacterium]
MKQLITILILSGILFSCSKSSGEEEYYTVTGQVLDLDSKLPIAGAKAYLPRFSDSALTDAAGRVSFRYKIGDPSGFFYVVKDGYLRPQTYWVSVGNVSRTDTFFLARPSFVNVTISKTGTYLVTDTVEIQVLGDNTPLAGQPGESPSYRTFHRDKANATDKLYNLLAVYNLSSNYNFWNHFGIKEKLYFKSEIIRGGSVFSTKTDSTNIIQFGTQNFTLNY